MNEAILAALLHKIRRMDFSLAGVIKARRSFNPVNL